MSPVELFLAAVATATIGSVDVWDDEATLDATVPGRRMRLRGAAGIRGRTLETAQPHRQTPPIGRGDLAPLQLSRRPVDIVEGQLLPVDT